MPNCFDFFCPNDTIGSLKSTLDNRTEANNHILENYRFLEIALERRRQAFTYAYAKAIHSKDKPLAMIFLRAAINFEKTVNACLKQPENLQAEINAYFQSSDYVHVSDYGINYTYTPIDTYAKRGVDLGLFLGIAAVIALSISVTTPATAILFGIALTILVPSAFYNLAITRTNKENVHKQELAVLDEFKDIIPTEANALLVEPLENFSVHSL